MSDRLSWDQYFLGLAKQVSTRATCKRLKVGAVLVKGNQVIATGYNGSLPSQEHCKDIGCLIIDGHCHRTVHAEQNTLIQCCREGISTQGAICYVTHSPCITCAKLLILGGITEVVYSEAYGSYPPEVINLIKESRLTMRMITNE